MERNEMIEALMKKARVTKEEAQQVLEQCNWDLLDAIIELERKGKVGNAKEEAIVDAEIVEENNTREERHKEEKARKEGKENKESCGGIGEVIGRMFRFIGRIIKKGNRNFFEIKKDNEKPIRISLTISVLIVIFLTVPSIVLLLIGLFCGYKYSIAGPNIHSDGVNEVFERVSKSADTIKKDFKEGYEN